MQAQRPSRECSKIVEKGGGRRRKKGRSPAWGREKLLHLVRANNDHGKKKKRRRRASGGGGPVLYPQGGSGAGGVSHFAGGTACNGHVLRACAPGTCVKSQRSRG